MGVGKSGGGEETSFSPGPLEVKIISFLPPLLSIKHPTSYTICHTPASILFRYTFRSHSTPPSAHALPTPVTLSQGSLDRTASKERWVCVVERLRNGKK